MFKFMFMCDFAMLFSTNNFQGVDLDMNMDMETWIWTLDMDKDMATDMDTDMNSKGSMQQLLR
jgi:hypothetical protein